MFELMSKKINAILGAKNCPYLDLCLSLSKCSCYMQIMSGILSLSGPMFNFIEIYLLGTNSVRYTSIECRTKHEWVGAARFNWRCTIADKICRSTRLTGVVFKHITWVTYH